MGEELNERLRARFAKAIPDTTFSFEAGDIIGQVLSFGSPTPVEVAIQGPAMAANLEHAEKVRAELVKLKFLRDLETSQSFDYPTLEVAVDRDRAGQYGLTASNVTRSLVAATSSSRFVEPNFWRDPASGNAFQIQVEIPQNRMASVDDVRNLPVMPNGGTRPLLGDVARCEAGENGGRDRSLQHAARGVVHGQRGGCAAGRGLESDPSGCSAGRNSSSRRDRELAWPDSPIGGDAERPSSRTGAVNRSDISAAGRGLSIIPARTGYCADAACRLSGCGSWRCCLPIRR